MGLNTFGSPRHLSRQWLQWAKENKFWNTTRCQSEGFWEHNGWKWLAKIKFRNSQLWSHFTKTL